MSSGVRVCVVVVDVLLNTVQATEATGLRNYFPSRHVGGLPRHWLSTELYPLKVTL